MLCVSAENFVRASLFSSNFHVLYKGASNIDLIELSFSLSIVLLLSKIHANVGDIDSHCNSLAALLSKSFRWMPLIDCLLYSVTSFNWLSKHFSIFAFCPLTVKFLSVINCVMQNYYTVGRQNCATTNTTNPQLQIGF